MFYNEKTTTLPGFEPGPKKTCSNVTTWPQCDHRNRYSEINDSISLEGAMTTLPGGMSWKITHVG